MAAQLICIELTARIRWSVKASMGRHEWPDVKSEHYDILDEQARLLFTKIMDSREVRTRLFRIIIYSWWRRTEVAQVLRFWACCLPWPNHTNNLDLRASHPIKYNYVSPSHSFVCSTFRQTTKFCSLCLVQTTKLCSWLAHCTCTNYEQNRGLLLAYAKLNYLFH